MHENKKRSAQKKPQYCYLYIIIVSLTFYVLIRKKKNTRTHTHAQIHGDNMRDVYPVPVDQHMSGITHGDGPVWVPGRQLFESSHAFSRCPPIVHHVVRKIVELVLRVHYGIPAGNGQQTSTKHFLFFVAPACAAARKNSETLLLQLRRNSVG
jgi:hypothetical protein